ncbi:MAG: nucleotidyltransferase family protein [Candidatus Diapherotrites archaeon]
MKAIILAAGYGTRLYPLTKNKPKPMLEIKGKTIIEYILEKISAVKDVDKIYIVTNAKFFDTIDRYIEELGMDGKIKVVNDHTESNEDRLGAIGDIAYVVDDKKIDEDILVVAGDNLFEYSLVELVDFFKEKGSTAVALHDVKDKKLAQNYGIVEIDKNGKIISFEEKPKKPKSTLVSTGCYMFAKEDLDDIRAVLKRNSGMDNSGDFIKMLSRKKSVYGKPFREKWFDIGSFESLGMAREEYNHD